MAASLPASAQTTTWTGTTSDDWNTPSNWSTSSVPNSGGIIIGTAPNDAVADGVTVPAGTLTTGVIIGATAGSQGILTLKNGSSFQVGPVTIASNSPTGSGTLNILDSQMVVTGSVRVGDTGNGRLVISGATARLVSGFFIQVGGLSNGYGYFEVSNGATVSAQHVIIGNHQGSGDLVVNGGHITSAGDLTVMGDTGDTRIVVSNGGTITLANQFELEGFAQTSTGYLTITGAGSRITNTGILGVQFSGLSSIGTFANGVALIADYGLYEATEIFIGYGITSTGIATVTSNASMRASDILTIGLAGNGTLTLSDGGIAVAPALHMATLNVNAPSRGTLNIGSPVGNAPVAPGTVSTDQIVFGGGQGTINFNHTSSNYVFDAGINNGADNATGSGTGLVGSGIVRAYSGRTILNADHGDFTGTLQADNAGILQVNGDMSNGTALVLAGGVLEGNGYVGTTANAGTIAPGASIGVLTIAGDYTGNGGLLVIEAVLGGDNAPTDRLVITGDVSGTTRVSVINLGGQGAQTANGIQIINIGGVSPGNAFTLQGDYLTETGQQAVVSGAYAYTLQHGGTQTTGDGNWYLVSEMMIAGVETQRLQPGTALYEQYPQVLAALNTVPTLQQRVGNRYWQQNGLAPGRTAGTSGRFGMWGRIEGAKTASDPARSDARAHRDIDLWKLQTGFDFNLYEGVNGSMLVGGVNVSHGTALAEIGSPFGRGKIDTTGTGIGATLTWYGPRGLYIDGQAQVTWFDSDITSTTDGRRSAEGNNGHGYVFSVETGNRYRLNESFSLTPQVQLTYSQVDFDSFSDPFNTNVSLHDGDSLRGRFGVSLDHDAEWIARDGTKSRSHIYGIVNLYQEFLNGTAVRVQGVSFRTRDERLWAGIGLGGTYEWDNGKYALYWQGNANTGLQNAFDSYAFSGNLGFRANW